MEKLFWAKICLFCYLAEVVKKSEIYNLLKSLDCYSSQQARLWLFSRVKNMSFMIKVTGSERLSALFW